MANSSVCAFPAVRHSCSHFSSVKTGKAAAPVTDDLVNQLPHQTHVSDTGRRDGARQRPTHWRGFVARDRLPDRGGHCYGRVLVVMALSRSE